MSLLDVTPARLAPGDRIEVQNRFDGSWCGGFEVAEVLGTPPQWSYRIRRLSDGEILPRLFDHRAIAESRPSRLESRSNPPGQPASPDQLAS